MTPYALGCPSCPHHVVVSAEDPDASLGDMHAHLHWEHPDDGSPKNLLAKVFDLTEEEVKSR